MSCFFGWEPWKIVITRKLKSIKDHLEVHDNLEGLKRLFEEDEVLGGIRDVEEEEFTFPKNKIQFNYLRN
ncbi:hypothetical protein RCL_jg13966.t1 [Rhizophagus clarus]|uniref:Uncharacterized protein n=1 Tax=Rhizophagus clarus TaxID=94130 RepID=A0A8H3LT94_9GLOM|nr:hypothetical protein RCL_jg13966.t1 [Rhizophagus clarus]